MRGRYVVEKKETVENYKEATKVGPNVGQTVGFFFPHRSRWVFSIFNVFIYFLRSYFLEASLRKKWLPPHPRGKNEDLFLGRPDNSKLANSNFEPIYWRCIKRSSSLRKLATVLVRSAKGPRFARPPTSLWPVNKDFIWIHENKKENHIYNMRSL